MFNLYKKVIFFFIGIVSAGLIDIILFKYIETSIILFIHILLLITIINFCNNMVIELIFPGSYDDKKWQVKLPGTHSLK